MENTKLDSGANAEEAVLPQEEVGAGYRVLRFPAADIPVQYRNLVYSQWLRSLRFANDYFKLVDSAAYYPAYHAYIERLLTSRPLATFSVAVLADESDIVLGWSVTEGTTLHYVYVQRDVRKQGIGRSLVPGPIDIITHVTKIGLSLWATKAPAAKFNPFA